MQLPLPPADFSDMDYNCSIAGPANTCGFKFSQIVYMFAYTELLTRVSYGNFCGVCSISLEKLAVQKFSPHNGDRGAVISSTGLLKCFATLWGGCSQQEALADFIYHNSILTRRLTSI